MRAARNGTSGNGDNGDGMSAVKRERRGKARRVIAPRTEPQAAMKPFPARMPMGEFLFEYLHRRGVRHSFGVPGDFALPTFAWLNKSKI